MCGRYVSVARRNELLEQYRAVVPGGGAGGNEVSGNDAGAKELAPSYNVAPTSKVYAVLERGREDGSGVERQVRAVRWGLVPYWWQPGTDAKTGKPKKMPSLHNARADSLASKRSWSAPLARRRTVLPAYLVSLPDRP